MLLYLSMKNMDLDRDLLEQVKENNPEFSKDILMDPGHGHIRQGDLLLWRTNMNPDMFDAVEFPMGSPNKGDNLEDDVKTTFIADESWDSFNVNKHVAFSNTKWLNSSFYPLAYSNQTQFEPDPVGFLRSCMALAKTLLELRSTLSYVDVNNEEVAAEVDGFISQVIEDVDKGRYTKDRISHIDEILYQVMKYWRNDNLWFISMKKPFLLVHSAVTQGSNGKIYEYRKGTHHKPIYCKSGFYIVIGQNEYDLNGQRRRVID